jgi:pantoate--beta-alanine ligase
MYPPGFATKITTGSLAERMCGASRPGHFDGVCTVVMKLLGIVQPDRIYLGEKDAQQLVILRRMITDLDVDVKVVGCPTVREKDGLALSSRNRLLSPEERAVAPRLYEALRLAQRDILLGQLRAAARLEARMRDHIEQDDAIRIDYIAIVDADSLGARETLTGRILIALAAYVGKTRLIDNIQVNVPGGQMAEGIEPMGR